MAKILVIDDEPGIRDLIRYVLSGAGHEVEDTGDCDEALTMMRQAERDLVITDMVIPGGSGLNNIERLRKEFPEVKIMAISGAFGSQPGDCLYEASRAGVQKTLAKPFDITEMADVVNDLVA